MPKQFETEHIKPWLDRFSVFEKKMNGEAQTPQHAMRRDALGILTQTGFPTVKHEEWRYTPVSPIVKSEYERPAADTAVQVTADDIQELRASFPVAAELVFVNGVYSEELSRYTKLPDGVIVTDLKTAFAEHGNKVLDAIGKDVKLERDPFAALNTAFVEDGAYISLPNNAAVEEPVHVMYVHANETGTPYVIYPRVLVTAGSNAQMKIVESHQNVRGGGYFSNSVVEIYGGDNTQIEHYKIQLESEDAYHVAHYHASGGRDAHIATRGFTFGGKLVRNNIESALLGEGGECTVNGLYMPRKEQHVDNHTLIDHAVPHCNSYETFKGLLDGESRGVFSGKIIVRQDAQKTDAKQSNNNILLSDKAHVDTKPQLEIFADDVKCTHGATIGRLDEKAMFYLRSRGLSKVEAFNVLSYAFASDLVNGVSIGGLRTWLDDFIHNRLREASH